MDEPIECHIEWNKSDIEGEILYDIHYMWNLKWNDANEFTYKIEINPLPDILFAVSAPIG